MVRRRLDVSTRPRRLVAARCARHAAMRPQKQEDVASTGWQMVNGDGTWQMANGKLKMANGQWPMGFTHTAGSESKPNKTARGPVQHRKAHRLQLGTRSEPVRRSACRPDGWSATQSGSCRRWTCLSCSVSGGKTKRQCKRQWSNSNAKRDTRWRRRAKWREATGPPRACRPHRSQAMRRNPRCCPDPQTMDRRSGWWASHRSGCWQREREKGEGATTRGERVCSGGSCCRGSWGVRTHQTPSNGSPSNGS